MTLYKPSRLRILARRLALLLPPIRRVVEQRDLYYQTVKALRDELDTEKAEGKRKADELDTEKAEGKRKAELLTSTIQELSQTVNALRDELDTEKAEGKRKAELLENLQDSRRQLREQVENLSIANSRLRQEIERGSRSVDELSGLLNWPEIRNDVERTNGMPELLEMTRLFTTLPGPLSGISSCWKVLNSKNLDQLLRDGYRNFKRTIGHNYFNFLVQRGDPQIAYLESRLDATECEQCYETAANLPDDPFFEWHDQASYRYFVLLLWSYMRKADIRRYSDRLEEPEEGNPLVVPCGGQRASQDLANSLLEYYSMSEAVEFEKCGRVLEIGGGYGRDAYVILKLNPRVQYTLVDIPPALFLAQRYLSSVFENRRVFRVRAFQSYQEAQAEMEQASIVCLLPQQLELLPDRHFDLSLNISSFGEMRPEQIKVCFETLERLTKSYFYMKQWKVSQNAFDHLSLTEEDYPVSPSWNKVYSRTCRVQTQFFEALYQVPGSK